MTGEKLKYMDGIETHGVVGRELPTRLLCNNQKNEKKRH